MEIYYFSGTGNCLKIAKDIAEATNGKVIAVSKAISTVRVIEDDCTIVFPVYAYEMPPLVRTFIKKVEFKSQYIAVIASYASSYGGALGQAKGLLKKRNVNLSYANSIKCVENYIPFFKLPNEERVAELIALQDKQSAVVGKEIAERTLKEVGKYFVLTRLVGGLFRTFCGFMAWGQRATPECNGCGICANLCPTKAISMVNNKPRFSTKCQQCQGCLNYCPKKAIKAKGYKPTSRRYTNPAIKSSELNK